MCKNRFLYGINLDNLTTSLIYNLSYIYHLLYIPWNLRIIEENFFYCVTHCKTWLTFVQFFLFTSPKGLFCNFPMVQWNFTEVLKKSNTRLYHRKIDLKSFSALNHHILTLLIVSTAGQDRCYADEDVQGVQINGNCTEQRYSNIRENHALKNLENINFIGTYALMGS